MKRIKKKLNRNGKPRHQGLMYKLQALIQMADFTGPTGNLTAGIRSKQPAQHTLIPGQIY